MSDLVILGVEDNSSPSYSIQLKREGVVINLTGATVNLYIIKAKTGELMNSGATSCAISDAVNGIITFNYTASVFADGGRYVGEVTVNGETLHETLQLPFRPKWRP